jgi:hypothetical protein
MEKILLDRGVDAVRYSLDEELSRQVKLKMGKADTKLREIGRVILGSLNQERCRHIHRAAREQDKLIVKKARKIAKMLDRDSSLNGLFKASLAFDLLFPQHETRQNEDEQQRQQQQQGQQQGQGNTGDKLIDALTDDKKSRGIPGVTDARDSWGALEVIDTPRPLPYKPNLAGRQRRTTYVGMYPRRIDRLMLNTGPAFRRKQRKQKGGSVLVDLSRSMGDAEPIVDAVLKHRRGMIVAAYAGRSRAESGKLTVIAADERSVNFAEFDSYKIMGRENIIDGPALEWLGKQAPPRFWISDGLVTGASGHRSPALVAQAEAICRRYGIKRLQLDDIGIPEDIEFKVWRKKQQQGIYVKGA